MIGFKWFKTDKLEKHIQLKLPPGTCSSGLSSICMFATPKEILIKWNLTHCSSVLSIVAMLNFYYYLLFFLEDSGNLACFLFDAMASDPGCSRLNSALAHSVTAIFKCWVDVMQWDWTSKFNNKQSLFKLISEIHWKPKK